MTMRPSARMSEEHARGHIFLMIFLIVVGVGYLTFISYLAFVNWKAAIFLLLLAIAARSYVHD